MTPERPTVVCAWCGCITARGGETVVHGMCEQCEPFVKASLRRGEKADRSFAASPGEWAVPRAS